MVKSQKKKVKYRLAKGIDGKERQWTAHENYQLYMQGWRAGAGNNVANPAREDIEQYVRGYEDGCSARIRVYKAAAKRFGYKPDILREKEKKATEPSKPCPQCQQMWHAYYVYGSGDLKGKCTTCKGLGCVPLEEEWEGE
jgi:hypothetical protein